MNWDDIRDSLGQQLKDLAEDVISGAEANAKAFADESLALVDVLFENHGDSPNFKELADSVSRRIEMKAVQHLNLQEAMVRERVFGAALGMIRFARLLLVAA